MKRRINAQLATIALFAVFASSLGVLLVCYGLFKSQVKHDLRKYVDMLSTLEVFNAKRPQGEKNPFFLVTSRNETSTDDIRITWIDKNGDVLFDSRIDEVDAPNHMNRPEIQAALTSPYGEAARVSDTFHMNTYYCARRLENGTILRASTRARSIFSVFLAIIPVVLPTIAVVIILCVLLGRLLTINLLRPIYEMIERLDNGVEIPVYPELSPLADKIRIQHENILEAAIKRLDFTANVSHELKTPLTAISGYTELLENNMVDEREETRILQNIRKNITRLQSLINDVTRLSEFDHAESQPQTSTFNLYNVVCESVESLQLIARKKNISVSFSGERAVISADRELIRELVINLVQNAIQYNNEGGFVNISVMIVNQRPVLKVSDNGIGVPKDQQERIFERFYRVDKSRSRETGGTGLGLSIVKHIVEIHGAKITLESELGAGSTFTVFF